MSALMVQRHDDVLRSTAKRSSPARAVRVVEINDSFAFDALRQEWDELVRATHDEVFYRHGYLRAWLDNFAPHARLRVLTARDADERLVAALPLLERRGSFYGMPVRELAAAANEHSCRFDAIAIDPRAAAAAFIAHLDADPSWQVLCLGDVPEGGHAQHLIDVAADLGMPAGAWHSVRSPYLLLPRTHQELDARIVTSVKSVCRKRRNKLAKRGRLRMERITGGPRLDEHLRAAFALEAAGWKGRRGTAMVQSDATLGFYRDIARYARDYGLLVLYFLRLDDRPIAFQYALCHRSRLFTLKSGYDEAFAQHSPGKLLVQDVLHDCIDRRLTEVDFLGDDAAWKRDWADRTRRHDWLFVFRRDRLGQALCAAKFRWAPRAKRLIARLRH